MKAIYYPKDFSEIINNKVRVFISSNCGDIDYIKVRKVIKDSLEKTNIFYAYVYEHAGASSASNQEGYLKELGNSDVVLFLIDNIKEIPVGVKTEYQKALELRKKALFIFKVDKSKEITFIQKDVINNIYKGKFKEVDSFEGYAELGIQSSILDLLKEYKYTYDSLRSDASLESANLGVIQNSVLSGEFEYNNRRFQNYSKTYATMAGVFERKHITAEADSIKDEIISAIARYLIGEKPFPNQLLQDFIKTLPNDSVCKERLIAVRESFLGNYDSAIKKLSQLKDGMSASNIKDDILIDLSNLAAYNDNNLGIMGEYKIQEEISKSKRLICAPILDRLKNNIFVKLEEERIELEYKYYSFRASNNLSEVFSQIASYLIASFETGSITHLRLTPNLIFNVLFYLHENEMAYDNIFLIKMGLISENYKQLKVIENNLPNYFFVKSQALGLFNLQSFYTDDYKKTAYKCNVVKNFYYYLDDKVFLEKYKEVFQIYQANNNLFLNSLLNETLVSTLERLNTHEIENLISWLVENKRIPLLQNIFEKLHYKADIHDEKFILLLITKVKNIQDQWYSNYRDEICSFLEYFALEKKMLVEQIGEFVEQFNPNFYKKYYAVNLYKTKSINDLAFERLNSIIFISNSRTASSNCMYAENNMSSLYRWFFYDKFRCKLKQETYQKILDMTEIVLSNKLSFNTDRETAVTVFICAYIYSKGDLGIKFTEYAKKIIDSKDDICDSKNHFLESNDFQVETVISCLEALQSKSAKQFVLFIALLQNQNKKMRNILSVVKSLMLIINETKYKKIFNDSCYFQMLVGLIDTKDKLSITQVIPCFKVLTKTDFESAFDKIFSQIYGSSYEVKREIIEIANTDKQKYPITFSKIELDQDYRVKKLIIK